MNANKAKQIIRILAILVLILSFFSGGHPIMHGITAACVLVCVGLLYRYLPQLSNISPDNPKTKTLRLVTGLSIALVIGSVLLVILDEFGLLVLSDQGAERLMAVLFAGLIIGFGNLAPKLPFNRYTGLRLPWTVADEETWVIAHRLLGYLAFPCGVLCFAGLADPANPAALPLAMLLTWIIVPSVLSGVFYLRKYHAKKK